MRTHLLLICSLLAWGGEVMGQCSATAPWDGNDYCPGSIFLNTNYGGGTDSVHWTSVPAIDLQQRIQLRPHDHWTVIDQHRHLHTYGRALRQWCALRK
ncbi:MAG: hypothetical protein IPK99_09340 [Flavobacteriales bacterium]|nr:hypothetical protein [Flavobacteriales bacterium]